MENINRRGGRVKFRPVESRLSMVLTFELQENVVYFVVVCL